MKSSPIKLVLTLAVAVVVALGVAACGSGRGPPPRASGTKIALELAGQADCPFCLAIQHGAEAAAKEEGVELSVQAPSKFDTSAQVSQLSSVLATKPEALILEPLDANALIAPVNQYKQEGIPTVMVDTTVNDPS